MDRGTWPESPEDAERRRAAAERVRREHEDLASVAATPEGFRLLLRLLRRWDAERAVTGGPECAALRNEAETLLAELALASPQTCLRLIAALRDIPFREDA